MDMNYAVYLHQDDVKLLVITCSITYHSWHGITMMVSSVILFPAVENVASFFYISSYFYNFLCIRYARHGPDARHCYINQYVAFSYTGTVMLASFVVGDR